MHKLKELYSSPASEFLVVRFEENIMSPGQAGGGYIGDNDLGDLED